MEGREYDRGRDDISQSAKPHTYTARSHEELIKSHLNLDGARKTKLQNKLDRLAAENDLLKSDLDDALRDNQNKDNEIRLLNDELREKPRFTSPIPSAARRTSPLYEVDGKQLSVDEVIDHFNVILQRHHDLINHKNQQIQELQDALGSRPLVRDIPKKDAFVQPSHDRDINHKMIEDFSKRMEDIRKEYEQAENKLIDRNVKLENMIDNLHKELGNYQNEIHLLRIELSQNAMPPKRSKSFEQLLQEKEKEISDLKNLIEKLKTTNDDNGDLLELVLNKKVTITRVDKIINDISLSKDPGNINLEEVDNDCKAVLGNINNMNDKLNSILNTLNNSPEILGGGEPLDKKYLIDNLENIKTQCREEIKVLENRIQPPVQKSASNITIDRPGTIPRLQPSHHSYGTPSTKSVPIYNKLPYPGPTHTSNLYPHLGCEACSTPYISQEQDKWIKVPSYNIPDDLSPRDPCRRITSLRGRSPQSSNRKLVGELRKKPPRSKTPKKDKGGCCGKKGSDTSNLPYSKKEDDVKEKGGGLHCGRKPSEERVMQVHEAPRDRSPRDRSPIYKIGLGSRMGNDYYNSRYR